MKHYCTKNPCDFGQFTHLSLLFEGDRGAEGQPAARQQPQAGEPGVGGGGRGGGAEGAQEEEARLLLNHVKVDPAAGRPLPLKKNQLMGFSSGS